MVQRLEDKFNKPVISGIPATYWYALRTLGIEDPIPGFGQLLLKPEIG
jgi:maleate cis-trans isomerase